MAFTRDTFAVHNTEYFSGMTEVLMQQAVDMQSAGGAFVYENRNMQGELEKASFFDSIGAGLIQDRNPTDLSAAVFNDLTMSETVGVKFHRTMKVEKAVSAFKAIGQDPAIMSFVLGQQQGKALALDYLNTGVAAVKAVIESIGATVTYDATAVAGKEDLTPSGLVEMKAKMGDASGDITTFVMHSRLAHDLLGDAVTSSASTIAGPAYIAGSFSALGVNVVITDSPALVDLDPTGDGLTDPQYFVLGLTSGAVRLTESESREVLTKLDDTRANITARVTTEVAYTVAPKGAEWVGANYPTAAQLGAAAGWNYVFSDRRSGPGVLGVFNARG